jgi:catechol 2,3-dioxygenase-like lactoylglutathione lyase family enzyme
VKFGYTIIFVQNVEKSLDFYQRAFSCKIKFVAESKFYGELDTGKTILAFCEESFCEKNGLSFNKNRLDSVTAGFEIGFIAGDVHTAYKHAVSQGAQPLKEPAQKPWGQIVAYVKDINGILIEICNEINY